MWVGAHILDENGRPAPQHLCFAQTRPQRIGRGPVSVGWIHALRNQPATLAAEDRRAPEPGALAERPGGAGEEHLDGCRAAQAPERLAHPQQRRAGGDGARGGFAESDQRGLGSAVAVLGLASRSGVAWLANTAPVAAPTTYAASSAAHTRPSLRPGVRWPRGRSRRRLASLHTTASSRASASPATATSQGDGPVEESGLARSGGASGRLRAGGCSITLSARLLRAGALRSSFAFAACCVRPPAGPSSAARPLRRPRGRALPETAGPLRR